MKRRKPGIEKQRSQPPEDIGTSIAIGTPFMFRCSPNMWELHSEVDININANKGVVFDGICLNINCEFPCKTNVKLYDGQMAGTLTRRDFLGKFGSLSDRVVSLLDRTLKFHIRVATRCEGEEQNEKRVISIMIREGHTLPRRCRSPFAES